MIEWQQKPTLKKISGQKLTPENSHAEFQYLYFDILILSNYRKCVEKSSFSNNWSRTSLHSRFSVLFLWTRKLLFSKRESIKYMNSGRISWLWIPIQIFKFRALLQRLPMMQPYGCELLYFAQHPFSKHLCKQTLFRGCTCSSYRIPRYIDRLTLVNIRW